MPWTRATCSRCGTVEVLECEKVLPGWACEGCESYDTHQKHEDCRTAFKPPTEGSFDPPSRGFTKPTFMNRRKRGDDDGLCSA